MIKETSDTLDMLEVKNSDRNKLAYGVFNILGTTSVVYLARLSATELIWTGYNFCKVTFLWV